MRCWPTRRSRRNRACLHRFDAAMDDLGLARSRLEAAGDRLGIARVNNYRGVLETERKRLADALPYFMATADTNEAFGVVEALRANLNAAQLLHWSQALAMLPAGGDRDRNDRSARAHRASRRRGPPASR